MPFDGFSIVNWVAFNFAGTPAPIAGGLGILMLFVGLFCIGWGFRVSPISYSLMLSGCAASVIAYYMVAGAINTGTELEGGQNVTSSVSTVIPWATGLFVAGFAGYALRLGWRSWASEEASAKLTGAIIGLGAFAGLFLAVQLIRGGLNPNATTYGGRQNSVIADPNNERDDPVRHRGVTRPPRR